LQQPVSIIAELEDAVRSGSSAKRISTLRQVTDLFLHDAERLSDDQVKVFDDVLCHLVARFGSHATKMGYSGHVRFVPASDRIADIAVGRFRAKLQH
jgi:hypothetical protein